ncbi:Na+-translocating ferredoxin:NAD+ oxidoreductase RnfA subunit [Paraburkholderia sp. 32]
MLSLVGTFAASLSMFIWTEQRCSHPLIDRLFRNATYLDATLSNFLPNGVAGSLLIVSQLFQEVDHLSSHQSGLMTAGYLVAILSTIRVGEKLQQRWGARHRPMLTGCAVTGSGVLITTFTYLSATDYTIAAFVGFTLVGIGLGFYATPSTDDALFGVPDAQAGEASDVYKMASALRTALGIAISAAIFTALKTTDGLISMRFLITGQPDAVRFAAAAALWFNVALVLFASLASKLGMQRQVAPLPRRPRMKRVCHAGVSDLNPGGHCVRFMKSSRGEVQDQPGTANLA